MRSSLMSKLSRLEQSAEKKEAPKGRLIVYDWSCPADRGLYALPMDALLTLGFNGDKFDISRAAFIDTETTGLSGGAGTVAFLVGVGKVEDGLFKVRQYLISDYSVEADMLWELKRELERFDTLIHYNGRRFDVPLISQRCVLKRMEDFTKDLWQLDLLYPARSIFKLRLGSCRLSNIESAVLGMPERYDIPGGEIPSRYFESVRTGNIDLLKEVVEHNRQDIATLSTLLVRLCDMVSAPEGAKEQADIYSLGRLFERQGQYATAKSLYTKAAKPAAVIKISDMKTLKYAGEANLRLYHIERRSREWDKCELTLKNMIKRRQMDLLPHLELCKLYEHRLKRYNDALSECQILIDKAGEDEIEALNRRRYRIIGKLTRQEGKANV